MVDASTPGGEIRTAEVIGSLCLATDLAIGLPFEHGLQSTLVAMRLVDRLGVEADTASETYYGCLLFYAGCTTDADVAAALFPDGSLLRHFNPVMYGSRAQTVRGVLRALADPDRSRPFSTVRSVVRLPRAARGHDEHVVAMCEVAEMLSDRLSVPGRVRDHFRGFTARWDGQGTPRGVGGAEIPLAVRIIQVARDATLHLAIGGRDHASAVVQDRAGKAFDPEVVRAVLAQKARALAFPETRSLWAETLDREPSRLMLSGGQLDDALAAMGDFADLISPRFLGHSSGVAKLAADAATQVGLTADEVTVVRRAGLIHDLGRVAISTSIWDKPELLTADDWEQIRLHAYHTERVTAYSPVLAELASIAGTHHERQDGSGYHRGLPGAMLSKPARLLAAADAYQTKLEPRPHRPANRPQEAGDVLARSANAGRLDPVAVAAVLAAVSQPVPPMAHPAGLTAREAEVITLAARGLLTKQIGRRIGISTKTADHHLQNAYAKIGVSTRAAAALFAMQSGLAAWGELPIPPDVRRS